MRERREGGGGYKMGGLSLSLATSIISLLGIIRKRIYKGISGAHS